MNWSAVVLSYSIVFINGCVHQKDFILTFNTIFQKLQSNLCEFTTQTHKFIHNVIKYFKNIDVSFKDFWYTKIIQTQIWYNEFNWYTFKVNNSPQTKRIYNLEKVFIAFINSPNLSLKYVLMYNEAHSSLCLTKKWGR